MSEQQVVDEIEKIVEHLPRSYCFGPYGLDDIRQFARMECLVCLAKGKYDPSRPLENYLARHIKRRLLNLRRQVIRADTQTIGCRACYARWQSSLSGPCGKETPGCRVFVAWAANQKQKLRFSHPCHLEYAIDDKSQLRENLINEVAGIELLERIDAQLPAELRSDYLRLLEGEQLGKARRLAVQEAILSILNEDDDLDYSRAKRPSSVSKGDEPESQEVM